MMLLFYAYLCFQAVLERHACTWETILLTIPGVIQPVTTVHLSALLMNVSAHSQGIHSLQVNQNLEV